MSRGKVVDLPIAVLLLLYVTRFDVAFSALLREGSFRGRSPNGDTSEDTDTTNQLEDYRQYLLNKYGATPQEEEAPVIEIQLLKGHVLPDESMGIGAEYVYSPKEYKKEDVDTEEQLKQEKIKALYKEYERKVIEIFKGGLGNSTPDGRHLPYIGSRNIIGAPSYCPKGQRKDNRGNCKTIVSS